MKSTNARNNYYEFYVNLQALYIETEFLFLHTASECFANRTTGSVRNMSPRSRLRDLRFS